MAASLAEVRAPIARRSRRECYADPSNKNSFMQNGTRLAAVDLGSNSFRLEIGHPDHGQIHRTEYLKETVRQGSGLDDDRNLTPAAMQRGWDCLARFGERLAGFKKHHVRAVATQTLREARNRAEFLIEAERILGFPIDVVSGREEARLIYQGVAHSLPQSAERRLVVDIGGRSTELILGQGFEAQVMESYRVGSVAWSMRYFPDAQFTPSSFRMAEIAAKAVLDEALNAYRPSTWDVAYGASGTIGAVADVLGLAGGGGATVTREGLDWLLDRLLKARRADNLRIEGLKDDRRAVIGGGLAVLRAVFDLLEIDEMRAAEGALRQGALYDLLDREHIQTDVRATTVQRLTRKFGVDTVHANRVSRIACGLFRQMRPGMTESQAGRLENKLAWAAQLHEIGAQISHSDYHKHGAYILGNSDAPGFSLSELERLGQLVLGHRGKLAKLVIDFNDVTFVQQLLALRLAVVLCHARRDPDLKDLVVACNLNSPRRVSVSLRDGWSEAWPQSAHLLREEANAWQRTPWSLQILQS